uniref:Coiled-coil domain-containing protein 52 n=1 Tax=Parastrongyloides trichosuri TaxID=131310 RepID=A0A0N4ZD82_PARTI
MTGKGESNKNAEYPRQLIQVTKSNKSEDVVRTELRFVSYDLKTNLEQRFGSSEGSAVTQALWSLLTHLNKLNKDGEATEDDLLMQKQILEIQLEKAKNNLENNEKYMREMMEMIKESEQVIRHGDGNKKLKYYDENIQKNGKHNNCDQRRPCNNIIEEDIVTSTYVNPGRCEVTTNIKRKDYHGHTHGQYTDKVTLSNSMCQALNDIAKRVSSLQKSLSVSDPVIRSKIKNINIMIEELRNSLAAGRCGSGKIPIKILKDKFEVLTTALNNLYHQHIQNQGSINEENGGFTKKKIHKTNIYTETSINN